jgi:3-hydroxyisobutyrate dehydrogenase-like beta-hydroxyacid dehydrogenase
MTKTLAFIGTGMIGTGLAKAALGRGQGIQVWNRSPEKTAPLKELGAHVAANPAEAIAGVERIHLALSSDDAVDSVLEQFADAITTQVIVDHTTTGPGPTQERAERLAERGIAYLHAPVFMSPAACENAGGMILAAGPQAVFQRVQSGLEEMTRAVLYLGEERGRAAAFKLFGNAMIISLTASLADVFAMAKALGIEAEDARALFDNFNPTGVLTHRGAKMAAGNYEASFELPMARKDVQLMMEAAEPGSLHVLPAIAARMDALIQAGYTAEDVGILAVDVVPKA